MKFYKIFLVFIVFFSLNQSSFAIIDFVKSEKPALSVQDCIRIALDNSPEIKKQRLNYNLMKKKVNIAQDVYFPTITAGTSYDLATTRSEKTNNGQNFNVSASLKQLIWNFGKTSANIRMKKFNKITAYYDFDNTVLNTTLGVKNRFYAVLASKAAIEVDKSNLQINERNYQRVKAYFDEGIKSKIDLVNAEVNLSDAKISLIQSETAYKEALIALNKSMFLAYNPEYNIKMPEKYSAVNDLTPISLTERSKKTEEFLAPPKNINDAKLTAKVEKTNFLSDFKYEEFPYNFDQCLEIAYKNRPDLKAYNSTLEAMKQSLLAVKRQFYPEISAQGSYIFRNINGNNAAGLTNGYAGASNTKNSNSFSLSVGLTSSVNILSQKHEVDAAKIQVSLAEQDIALLKQNIYFEVQQAYVVMIQNQDQIPILGQKVKQSFENLELADGRYAVGLGDYIQLQDAKVKYNNAQHSLIKTILNYNVAKAKLEQVIALEQDVTISLEDKL